MKLRLFQVYDKNGNDSRPVLQYWSEGKWRTVHIVRVPEKDCYEAMRDPNKWYED